MIKFVFLFLLIVNRVFSADKGIVPEQGVHNFPNIVRVDESIDDTSILRNLVKTKDAVDSHLRTKIRNRSAPEVIMHKQLKRSPSMLFEKKRVRRYDRRFRKGNKRGYRQSHVITYPLSHIGPSSSDSEDSRRSRLARSRRNSREHVITIKNEAPVDVSSEHVDTAIRYCFRNNMPVSNRLRPRLYSKLLRAAREGKSKDILIRLQSMKDSSSEEEKDSPREKDECRIMRLVLESLTETMSDLELQLLEDNKKMLSILQEMQEKDRLHERQKEILKADERKKTLATSVITGVLSVLTTLLASQK